MIAGRTPRVSIIMPVWNGLPFLTTAVQSVLDQEFQDWELLIRDDGSSDGSAAFLRTLTDERIILLPSDGNRGIFGNLNALFARARAPISQILCQDDHFGSPQSLGAIVDAWASLPSEVGFMRCNAVRDGKGGRLKDFAERVLPKIVTPSRSDLYFFLFGCIPGNLSNVSLRTDLVERVGGFDQGRPYSGDFDFWMRAARQVAYVNNPNEWVYVRHHEGQASSHLNRSGELMPQLFPIIDTLYDRVNTGRDTFILRTFATVTVDAQHRWIGLKVKVRGLGSTYLNAVDREADASRAVHGPALRWLLFFLTLGGRIGSTTMAKMILGARRDAEAGLALAGQGQTALRPSADLR